MNQLAGYFGMSDVGRRVCEFIEAATRIDVERYRMQVVPTHEVSLELLELVKDRYSSFSELERAAVVDLRGRFQYPAGRPRWQYWLKQHLAQHPGDAVQLCLLESEFGGTGDTDGRSISIQQLTTCGAQDFNWKMPW